MKTYCKQLVIDRAFFEAGYRAWLDAPAGKKNAWRVDAEYGGADALIDGIWEEYAARRLEFEPFKRYTRQEKGSRKERRISVASVKYQVVTYAAKLALDPMLAAKLGYYQVAGVGGKGQKLARSAIKRWSRDGTYHVKCDVRKCYEHITCDLVMGILGKHVAHEGLLYLCGRLLACYELGVLEIGTYFSLLMANLVLSYAYHFVEGLHKTRRGARKRLVAHQIWHLDDVLLVGYDKRDLKMAVRALERYMRDALGLEVKPWKVCKTSRFEPLDMGGFRSCAGRVTLRRRLFRDARRSFLRFARRRCLALAARAVSYWGWVKHSDSLGFRARNGVDGTVRAAKEMVSKADKRKDLECRGLAAQPS